MPKIDLSPALNSSGAWRRRVTGHRERRVTMRLLPNSNRVCVKISGQPARSSAPILVIICNAARSRKGM
jgi:hypothetical protein